MNTVDWISLSEVDVFPKEKIGVLIYVKYNENDFNIFTAHHEERVWFMYDGFTKKVRPLRNQQEVTHWAELPKHPSNIILLPKMIK